MNTFFTVWHYGAVILITLALLVAILTTLLQPKLSSKFSIILAYILASLGLMLMAILTIDSYTKKITLSDVDDKRFLPTEKIIFTGYVRNSGDYTINEVSVEIKIVNKDTAAKEGEPMYQSNAFAEILGDKGMEYKPSFITVTEVVATNLKPGERKQFRIVMPHPSHFKGYTDYVRAFGQ